MTKNVPIWSIKSEHRGAKCRWMKTHLIEHKQCNLSCVSNIVVPVIVFKSFDGHVQSALAQMAVIILVKRPRRNERMQQEHRVDWKRGSRKASKMKEVIYYSLPATLFKKVTYYLYLPLLHHIRLPIVPFSPPKNAPHDCLQPPADEIQVIITKKNQKIRTIESQSVPETGNIHTHPGFINSNSLVVSCSPWIKWRINHAAVLAGASGGWRLQFALWKESCYLHPIMGLLLLQYFCCSLNFLQKIWVMDTFQTVCLRLPT